MSYTTPVAGEAAILDSFLEWGLESKHTQSQSCPVQRVPERQSPEVNEGIQIMISKNGMIEAGEGGARSEEIVS